MSRKFVVISPVRNEAEFFDSTLRSMVGQTVKPDLWLIVDDGSTDATSSIAKKYAADNPWIRVVNKPDRGARAVGPGVVDAFYYGLAQVDIPDYQYLCKMDGDIEFGSRYFESLFKALDGDPKLGAASGKPFLRIKGDLVPEKMNDEMVAGQINFYRRECFEAIDGFVQEVHWDAIAFHRGRMAGWKTRSFSDEALQFIHLRLMGSSERGIVNGRMRWGKGQYFIGTHPLYLIAIGAYRSLERPFIVGGLCIVLGYIQAHLRGDRQYEYPGFRQSLRAWQLARLGLGKRLESGND